MLLHVDEALIVAVKPAGLLAVPGRGPDKQDCLSSRIQQAYPDALVVHRLDRDTSGLICFARGATAQRTLSMAFANRHTSKEYVALVRGQLPIKTTWELIDLPLILDWPNRPISKVDHVIGKPSQTRWQARDVYPDRNQTRVALIPITGRSHQLRVHLAAIGHPIIGDPLYGESPCEERRRDDVSITPSRMFLHSSKLSLPHPLSGKTMNFASDADF